MRRTFWLYGESFHHHRLNQLDDNSFLQKKRLMTIEQDLTTIRSKHLFSGV
jgi:hypothetical protein